MRQRVAQLCSVMLLVGAAAVISPVSALGAPSGTAGGTKLDAQQWRNDPHSGAALNRIAAQSARRAPSSTTSNDPSARILQGGVNDASADTTAQDTQSETTIGALGNNVIIGWNDSGSNTGTNNHFTGFGTSSNGGLSFTDRGTLPASGEGDAGDPVVAVDQASSLVYMATLGFTTGEHLQVFKSTTLGATYGSVADGSPGYLGTNDFQDKEWLAVDNFSGAGQHNVYLCWTRFGFGGQEEIRFTRSTNLGGTFGPSGGTLLSGGGQGCFVTVGPDHSVYVTYYRGTLGGGQGGDNKIFIRRSTDRGVTFGAETQVADLRTTSVNGELELPGGLRSNSFPHAAVNPVNGNIYVVFNDDPVDADPGDIFTVKSSNFGATWSAPVQANNDDGGRSQFFPTVGVALDGTSLMIGYYSRANDPTDLAFHRQSRIASINTGTGALTWRLSFALGPDTPVVIGQDPVINATYMGDYDQIAATPGAFHSSWSDNRTGNSFHRNQPDVRYARIGATPLSTDPAIGLSGPSSATIGSNIALRATLTNPGTNTADDVFAVVTLPAGLVPKSAAASGGGSCTMFGQLAECSMGSVLPGATKTIDFIAFVTSAGSKTTIARITTSDFDVNSVNNTATFATSVTGTGTTLTYSTGNIAMPIPDLGSVDIHLAVPDDGSILNLLPRVRLNHTFDADLAIFLISPAGTMEELSTNNGGSGDNYGSGTNDCAGTRTIFADSAATSITNAAAPFAGSFKPEQPLSSLASENPQGGWILRVIDQAGADVGTVGCFQLTVTRG